MLIHSKCGNKVALDLSSVLKFASAFGVSARGLSVNTVSMVRIGSSGKSRFICTNCSEEVPESDLQVMCNQCGCKISATAAVIPNKFGGMYCRTCATAYYGTDTSPLNLKTFTLTRDATR